MKIYRGPKTKAVFDDSFQLVDEIKTDDLTESILTDNYIRFNISKDAYLRESSAVIDLSDKDLLIINEAINTRFFLAYKKLNEIRELFDSEDSYELFHKKVEEIIF